MGEASIWTDGRLDERTTRAIEEAEAARAPFVEAQSVAVEEEKEVSEPAEFSGESLSEKCAYKIMSRHLPWGHC